MVGNLNKTWKTSCIKILNYVSSFSRCIVPVWPLPFSSPNELQIHSLKSARLRSCGDSGWVIPRWNLLIVRALKDKPPKLRTTSSQVSLSLSLYSSTISCSLSLDERHSLRIISRVNGFLILLSNISWLTVVGTILHPGGPTHGSSIWKDGMDVEYSGDGVWKRSGRRQARSEIGYGACYQYFPSVARHFADLPLL